MPRLAFAVLLCCALLLPIGGCYRYDARAKNLTNQPVRISLHKGCYAREISTAVLAPGTSVGWNGAVNGPVFLRVMAGPEVLDVSLPRRAHTQLEVSTLDSQLHILKIVGDESVELGGGCPADCDKPCCAAEADGVFEESESTGAASHCDIKGNSDPAEVVEGIEVIEIIEEDAAEPTEEPGEEMIDLIESDDG